MSLCKRTGQLLQLFSTQNPGLCFSNNNLVAIFSTGNRLKFFYSTNNNQTPSVRMTEVLKLKLPKAKQIEVVDVSGGCGSMYEIFVESVEFKGLTTVKQHRLINEILKDDIKQMHGLRIMTKIPEENG